jgi:hypothetical protein
MAKNKLPTKASFEFDFVGLGFQPKSPYDLELGAVKDYEVYVDPRVILVMDRQGDFGSSAARLLYSQLSESTDRPGELSIKFRHTYGLTIGQEKAVEGVSNTQREFQAQLLELVAKISTESGQSMEAIGKRLQVLEKELQENPDALINDPLFAPYAGDLLRLTVEQSRSTPIDACRITVRLQKKIPSWTLDHTLSLHKNIYDQLIDFDRVDSVDLLAGSEPEGEAPEVLTSSPDSSSLDLTSLPTGTKSDTTLSSGESEI